MKELDLSKTVTLNCEDIIICIENELERNGLKPRGKIKLEVGTQSVGIGMSERQVGCIEDVVIECERLEVQSRHSKGEG